MKIVKILVTVSVVALLSFGIYNLWVESNKLEAELDNVSEEFNEMREENRSLQAQIEYFENPENLIEEAKKNFNFREEGENLMIIVPDGSEESDSSEN